MPESIANQLERSRSIINNCQTDPVLIAVLADFGYGTDQLNEGLALYNDAKQKEERTDIEYGEERKSYQNYATKRDELNKRYMRHIKLARIVLKDDLDGQVSLKLSGRRKYSFADFSTQVRSFYSNALLQEPIKLKLDRFVKEADLQQGLNEITTVSNLYDTYLREQGEAQRATLERDDSIDRLQDWISDLIAVARIAFEDDPQQLEKLGITA